MKMEAIATPENLEAFLGLIVAAIKGGQWPLVAVLTLILGVWAVRKFLGPKYPALLTGAAGASLNILAGFLTAVGVSLIGGIPFTWALAGSALLSSVAAGWFSLASAFFPGAFSRGNAAASISEAEKRGLAAAVAATPPTSDSIANGP
jgi:membrane-bound metal-dependent hydrolase YbcI (DUF457 family)